MSTQEKTIPRSFDDDVKEKQTSSNVEALKAVDKLEDIEGTASLLSSHINLLKTIIGAGIIALPRAIYGFGYIIGPLLMVVSGIASCYGLYLYILCASRVGRKSTPFAIASITYPKAANVLDTMIVLKCIGVSLSYILLIGNMMSSFMKGFPSVSPDDVIISPRIWIVIFMGVITPLSFFKKMDHLKYSSLLGLITVIYLLILSLVNLLSLGMADSEDIVPVPLQFNFKTLSGFGTFVFAFTCHQNIFHIHNETRKNSPTRLFFLSVTCISLSFIIYIFFGMFSYLTYAKQLTTKSTLFDLYSNDIQFQIARVLFAFLLAFSVPLQVLPYRNSLQRLMGLGPEITRKYEKWIFIGLTGSILIFILCIAMGQPAITAVLSLVGSVTSSTICYILPGAFYYKLSEKDNPVAPIRIGAIVLFCFGVAVFFVCTASSIASFFV